MLPERWVVEVDPAKYSDIRRCLTMAMVMAQHEPFVQVKSATHEEEEDTLRVRRRHGEAVTQPAVQPCR